MFVKNFKSIQKQGVHYKPIVDFYDWNKNTEKFEKKEINWQNEINKNKHIELKEMLARNIKPQSDIPMFYGDSSVLANKNLVDMYNIANTEIEVLDSGTAEKVEKSDNSSSNTDTINKDSGTAEKVEKSK